MSIRALIRDSPHRSIALVTSSYALIFRHSPTTTVYGATQSTQSLHHAVVPRCIVEFAPVENADLIEYRQLSILPVLGTLGLITIDNDVFLCLVSGASKVATVRPGETVQRIFGVEFHCLNRSDFDYVSGADANPYTTEFFSQDGPDYSQNTGRKDQTLKHPCLALKKLLSGGSFYYSVDFDLTNRLQDRSAETSSFDPDNLDEGFLWNSYMIGPLVRFRSRLAIRERKALDSSKIITSAIRGFVQAATVPASVGPSPLGHSGLPSTLTLISRLSCLRAGTRFHSRGIDDNGNVANFVETEVLFWSPSGLCFSYAQIRGSVPVFWEQSTGFLPQQRGIQITRSLEATQPAFDKHFESLEVCYGAVHVINLLSETKLGEAELSMRYRLHVQKSPLNNPAGNSAALEHHFLQETDFDFHEETKGAKGYDAANQVRDLIESSAESFAYFMLEEPLSNDIQNNGMSRRSSMPVLQQNGVFRTNCLDCLDRTNLIQTIVSRMAVELFLANRAAWAGPEFWMKHSVLWADNGDALSKIYAGTGALKSSFTRHGKMSLAGAIADARKSATRMYINNFADEGRQNTIDILLGRLVGQLAVHLYDPINEYVTTELNKRASEYSSIKEINIWVGTFNLNGRMNGIYEDLSSWLCPNLGPLQKQPEIVVVGFQEIVELSTSQILSTDLSRRKAWEEAVKRNLNSNAQKNGSEGYILLRSGQLVGAALCIFAKSSVLNNIKNVEGGVKKTGISGMAGNKGAVAIRMEYDETRICFVTAHLAAGFANYEERNRDYWTINHGLRLQNNRTIDAHDSVIWLGDFNYRIGLGAENVHKYLAEKALGKLYENDQLNLQMVNGLAFQHYAEAKITFWPTYRFDIGVDEYDTSEKARIPAWCDRILYRGHNLRQTSYNSVPVLRFSDHRPVYATFICKVDVVDSAIKEKLSQEIYDRRKNESAAARADDTDDEEQLGYDPIEPGLPLASSNNRKWWLDNLQPARSNLQAPGPEFFPNPRRPSNPFTSSDEPDWITIPKKYLASSSASLSDLNQNLARSLNARRLPPPFEPLSPASSLSKSLESLTSPAGKLSLIESASDRSVSSQSLRKSPPPVPKKPLELSCQGSHRPIVRRAASSFLGMADQSNSSSNTSTSDWQMIPQTRQFTNFDNSSVFPKEALSTAPLSSASKFYQSNNMDGRGPKLPPRPLPDSKTPNPSGLMDDHNGIQQMASWQPLNPRK